MAAFEGDRHVVRRLRYSAAVAVLVTAVTFVICVRSIAEEPERRGIPRRTVAEARDQARLLHETMHATLQVVHRDFYREDEGLPIPAATLEDVFAALGEGENIKLRWIAVTAQAMNSDNVPQDAFEKQAAAALSDGKQEHEAIESGVYRRAAGIRLHSECLKCHSPNRTSNAARQAGLVIAIPIDGSSTPRE